MNFKTRARYYFSIITSLVLLSCSVLNLSQNNSSSENPQESYPVAMTTFRLALPEPVTAGEQVFLLVLDEVTGLAFNQQRIQMQAEDASHFFVILPFPVGSVVKYRYALERTYTVQEHTSDGRPVRYRMVYVTGPGKVDDTVSRWTDTSYHLPSGRIVGRILDNNDGHPLPNILITSGGIQTVSNSDGTFLIEGLPTGTHNLVAYSMDGEFYTYQQEATIANDSATEALLRLQKAGLVPVSFIVNLPENTPSFAPVRLVGNLTQLGNSYGDLRGGLNIAPGRAPLLTRLPNGQYTFTLTLPVGADLRYKYTLGDGIWNSEQTNQNMFRVRQLIVPNTNTMITDQVETWQSGQIGSITFHVTIPETTLSDEYISLQLNPGYGWTEPIPMWNEGNNQWIYTLFNPLEGLPNLHYRYCRLDLCGSADEVSASGPMAIGREIKPSPQAQVLTDVVESWAWYPSPPSPVTVPSVAIQPRQPDFKAGIAFQSNYTPVWGPNFDRGLKFISQINANWVILSPTWSITRSSPPRLEQIPGDDLSSPEIIDFTFQAQSQDFSIAIFPTLRFPESFNNWFSQSPRDYSWWVSWFDVYRKFILHHADIASQAGAGSFIMGGDWVLPTIPENLELNEFASSISMDTESTWRSLLQDVRMKFNGTLLWALPYPIDMNNIPTFLDMVDGLYVIWSGKLTQDGNATEDQLYQQAAFLLDQEILPLQKRFGKAIILAIHYPSIDGATTGCLPAIDGGCLDVSTLDQPFPDHMQFNLDMDEQAKAYNAILLAVNERPWISGVVSQGYFPFAPLQDKSASVNGKPASGVLWYWFPQMVTR